MSLREVLYGAYERRLAAARPSDRLPKHVGVILDGNRRWARAAGIGLASGHRRGADKIDEFLGWCAELRIDVVTLWLLSTDNLTRTQAELAPLLQIIEGAVDELAASRRWRINPVGALDLLPDATARSL
jgi:short-chain Z-isoprenyl diphosphate synthase